MLTILNYLLSILVSVSEKHLTLNFGIRNFDDQVSESNPAVAVLATTAKLKHRSGANAKHGHGEEVLGRSLENEPKESGLCVVIQ